ncbi:MAG: lipid II:glycine glycyltransferase FemX [Ardenticatenaceae bacterium]
MSYETTTAVPDAVWEGFVANEPAGNFLQTAAWGRFREGLGWRARRIAIRRDGVLAAGAQVLFRPLPPGRTFAYMPRGPVAPGPGNEPALLERLFDGVHRLCRAAGALLLTVEPNWELPAQDARALNRLGFRATPATIQPAATILLDLRPPEEEILGQMHSKWRYNIRLSARKEVMVRVGDEKDFDLYHDLSTTTGERDAFAIRPRGYYKEMWRRFQPNRSRLLIAEYAGQALAAIIVVRVGKTATYLYGASSNEERNRMPNHALQWAAIQWARSEGCDWYDLWGIPTEVPADGEVEAYGEGGLWGVYRFKQGFGGRVVKYPGAFDYPYSRLGYLAYRLYQRGRLAS